MNRTAPGFTAEGAWDYAAALKAAYLGFKAAAPELPVAIGGYAGTDNFAYADAVMRNGAGEYFDIFNIHTYDSIRDYPEFMETVRSHMKRFGIEKLPVWFTEHGSPDGGGRTAGELGSGPEDALPGSGDAAGGVSAEGDADASESRRRPRLLLRASAFQRVRRPEGLGDVAAGLHRQARLCRLRDSGRQARNRDARG